MGVKGARQCGELDMIVPRSGRGCYRVSVMIVFATKVIVPSFTLPSYACTHDDGSRLLSTISMTKVRADTMSDHKNASIPRKSMPECRGETAIA